MVKLDWLNLKVFGGGKFTNYSLAFKSFNHVVKMLTSSYHSIEDTFRLGF
jgi:hypothetical protein